MAVIEALLAATQGVKDITVGYGQCGNLIQDVAAIRALKSVCQEYLDKHGFHDVRITTVFHQWMGGFPQDEAKAFGVISWGAATAALAKATKVIVKTPHEAMGVPTKEANAAGLRATKQVISMLRTDPGYPRRADGERDRGGTVYLDRVEELERGLRGGTVAAFGGGVLISHSHRANNAGRSCRQGTTWVRSACWRWGTSPSRKSCGFHRAKLRRGKAEKSPVTSKWSMMFTSEGFLGTAKIMHSSCSLLSVELESKVQENKR